MVHLSKASVSLAGRCRRPVYVLSLSLALPLSRFCSCTLTLSLSHTLSHISLSSARFFSGETNLLLLFFPRLKTALGSSKFEPLAVLSLSLSHTHTHIHTHKLLLSRALSLSLSPAFSKHKLDFTHKLDHFTHVHTNTHTLALSLLSARASLRR